MARSFVFRLGGAAQGQEVTIYSGQVSGSSAQTSAGHFHWYR